MSCSDPNCRKMGCAVTYILPEGLAEEINSIQSNNERPIGPVDKDGNPPKPQYAGSATASK